MPLRIEVRGKLSFRTVTSPCLIDQAHLTKNQEISVVVTSFSYTVLAIVSIFGFVVSMHPCSLRLNLVIRLIGTITKRQSFVSLYSTTVWYHLGFSIATGVYFIYTLFHKVGNDDVNNCVNGDTSQSKQDECKKAFDTGRGIIIGLYIFFWLIELCMFPPPWFAIAFADS